MDSNQKYVNLKTIEEDNELEMYWQLRKMVSASGNEDNITPEVKEYGKLIKEIEILNKSKDKKIKREIEIKQKQETIIQNNKILKDKILKIRPKIENKVRKDTQLKNLRKQIETMVGSKVEASERIMEMIRKKGNLSFEAGRLGKEVEILEEEVRKVMEIIRIENEQLGLLVRENKECATNNIEKTFNKLLALLIHYHGENMMIKNLLNQTEEDEEDWEDTCADIKKDKTKEIKYEEAKEVIIMDDFKNSENEDECKETVNSYNLTSLYK